MASSLPAAFDLVEWLHIPAGDVHLKGVKVENSYVKSLTVSVDPFYMAKYPITNQQFAIYKKEHPEEFIPELTCRWSASEAEVNPLHPVHDLYWHEAMLFCEWFSGKVGYQVTLPTDAQWQRAAQGDDNRKYPWGDEWDSSICNVQESGIGHTTPVDQYPEGASPFGVMDMVGNVFEWCLTDPHTRSNDLDLPRLENIETFGDRVFRGSGPATSTYSADVTKYGATPIIYTYLTGIRLVTSNPS